MNMTMWILSFKFNDNEYYVKFNEDLSYIESYNPYTATTFPSKNKAEEFGKKHTVFGDYVCGIKMEEATKKFDEWSSGGYIRRTFSALSKFSRPYNNETALEVLNWWIGYCKSCEEIRSEDYVTWPHLYSCYKHIWSLNKYSDGINCTIYVRPNSTFSNFKSELDLVLPHIIKIDNAYHLQIFDHYLSEDGGATLVGKDDSWSVEGDYNTLCPKTTLEKCFEYILKERYYN